jgi:hypothetical protein
MGFGLFGTIKPVSCSHDNKCILVVIDYVTKRVEAKGLRTNMVVIIIQFIYKIILIGFGCPLTLISDQGTHLINEAIKILPLIFCFSTLALQLTTLKCVLGFRVQEGASDFQEVSIGY